MKLLVINKSDFLISFLCPSLIFLSFLFFSHDLIGIFSTTLRELTSGRTNQFEVIRKWCNLLRVIPATLEKYRSNKILCCLTSFLIRLQLINPKKQAKKKSYKNSGVVSLLILILFHLCFSFITVNIDLFMGKSWWILKSGSDVFLLFFSFRLMYWCQRLRQNTRFWILWQEGESFCCL